MRALLKEHVQTIASRDRGRVRVRDVVNEAFTHDGSPDSTSHLLWGAIPINDNVFSRSLAFSARCAKAHDPGAPGGLRGRS